MNYSIASTFIVLALLIMLNPAVAQDGGMQLSGFSASAGRHTSNITHLDKAELKMDWAAKYGGLFDMDVQDGGTGSFYYGRARNYGPGSPQLFLHALLSPQRERFGLPAANQSLEIGLGLNPDHSSIYSFGDRDEAPFDTLSSDLGPIRADSVHDKHLWIMDHYERLSVNIQYQLSTNPLGRINFYLAPALMFDLYFNRRLQAEYEEREWVAYYLDENNQIKSTGSSFGGESIVRSESQLEELPNRYGISLTVPIGVRYRLSKNADWEWLNKIYLFMQGRPGINYLINQNEANKLQSVMSLSAGIRIWGLHLDG